MGPKVIAARAGFVRSRCYAGSMSAPTYPGGASGQNIEQPVASATWDQQAAGTANTTLNQDKAADADATKAHYLTSVELGFTGAAPTAGTVVTVESPVGTVKARLVLAANQATQQFAWRSPLKCPDNSALRVAVPAAGAAAVAQLSYHGYTK